MQYDDQEIRKQLLHIARECVERGPGFAQQYVALREAAKRLGAEDVEAQQRLLTHWHDLFRDGQLSWGYDVDNPGSPFFHIPLQRSRAAG